MAEIKLKKRYKYAGDIFSKLIDIKFDVETATDFLNDIKDADVVEVKHGKWLHKKIDKINYYVYGQCSNCLERKRIDNYCPNCGAKMDGGADNGNTVEK